MKIQQKIILNRDELVDIIAAALDKFVDVCPRCQKDLDILRYVDEEDINKLIDSIIKE